MDCTSAHRDTIAAVDSEGGGRTQIYTDAQCEGNVFPDGSSKEIVVRATVVDASLQLGGSTTQVFNGCFLFLNGCFVFAQRLTV